MTFVPGHGMPPRDRRLSFDNTDWLAKMGGWFSGGSRAARQQAEQDALLGRMGEFQSGAWEHERNMQADRHNHEINLTRERGKQHRASTKQAATLPNVKQATWSDNGGSVTMNTKNGTP